MYRRVVATAAAVALVAVAGCSALPVFDGPGSTPTATPSPAADGTPTAAPIEYPEGYGATGVVDADAAAANHVRALSGYDSYRYRFDVGVGNGTGTADAFVYLLRVEHTDRQALEIRDDGDATRFQYFETDRLYLKLEAGEDARYNSTDSRYDRERFSGIQFLAPLFDHVDYGGPDVRETENGTYYRYRSEAVTDGAAILPADVTDEEIASFDVTLVVHEDGSVRAARYDVVTERDTHLSALATVEAVNDTSVERPDWFERAADG